MPNQRITELARREREILEIVYKLGEATAVDVMNNLPGEPVNATVRSMLNILESKGFLRHECFKGRYVYYPTIHMDTARKSMLEHVMETFFEGAEGQAIISILRKPDARLSREDCRRIIDMIEEAQSSGH